MRYTALLLSMISLTLFSCEKEIDIDVPIEATKLVVEGSIEQNLPPFVMLTKSESYFAPTDLASIKNRFVHNATVTVSNGTNAIQLTEICTDQLPDSLLPAISELIGVSIEAIEAIGFCLYTSLDPLIFGEIGKTYTLNIKSGGEELTATTTIPVPVIMDSYWYKDQPGFSEYGYLWFRLSDPPGLGNAYRMYMQRKGIDERLLPANGSVFEDKFVDGLTFDAFVYRGHEPNAFPDDPAQAETADYFQQGDTIIIKFCTIDMPHFNFIQSYELASFSNGNPFAAPTTVQTNIEGGLGVWGGYASVYDTLVAAD